MDSKSSFTGWLANVPDVWLDWNSCFYDFWKVFSVCPSGWSACLTFHCMFVVQSWISSTILSRWRQNIRTNYIFMWSLSVQPKWEDWCWNVPLWAHKTVTIKIPARPWERLHGVTGNIPSIVNVPRVFCGDLVDNGKKQTLQADN